MDVCPQCFGVATESICPEHGVAAVHYTKALIGHTLDRYVVESLIAQGGMGVVYKGEHTGLGRSVALKVLRPDLSLRDDIVERFVREAKAVATIEHPNIVNVYDFGKTPLGCFYMAMEFIKGKTLHQLIKNQGKQPAHRVALVVNEIGDALAAAHGNGLIHRDVKPANIMIGPRGSGSLELVEKSRLLDFGIAKLSASTEDTGTGGTLGTPTYMSPEQLDGLDLDRRSDIYSFGCVIYEMLTGAAPYDGRNQAGGVRAAQLGETVIDPQKSRTDLEPAMNDAVMAALSLDPEARPQSMRDFVAMAFGRLPCPTARPRPQPGAPRKKWVLPALVAMLLACAAVAFFTWRGSTPTIPPRHALATKKPTEPIRPKAQLPLAQIAMNLLRHAAAPSAAPDRRLAVFRALHVVRPLRARSLLIAALSDEQRTIRRLAALTLAQLPAEPKTRAALRAAMPRQTRFARIAMAKALVQLGDAAALQELKHAPEAAKQPFLRRFALEMLSDVDAKAGRKLAQYEKVASWQLSPRTKAELLMRMARAGDRRARRRLRSAISSPRAEQRLHAASALAELDGKAAAPKEALAALVALARATDHAGIVRVRAANRLLKYAEHAPTSVALLLEMLDATDERTRIASVQALGRARAAKVAAADGKVKEKLEVALRRLIGKDGAISNAQNGELVVSLAVALTAFDSP